MPHGKATIQQQLNLNIAWEVLTLKIFLCLLQQKSIVLLETKLGSMQCLFVGVLNLTTSRLNKYICIYSSRENLERKRIALGSEMHLQLLPFLEQKPDRGEILHGDIYFGDGSLQNPFNCPSFWRS